MKARILGLFFCLFLVDGLAQQAPDSLFWNRELDFVHHLQARREFSESLWVLEQLVATNQQQHDTLNFLKGWLRYQQKELLPSALLLRQVSTESAMYFKSRFFAAYNYAYLQDYEQSMSELQLIQSHGEPTPEALLNLQMAGLRLLNRDLQGFEQYATNFSGAHFGLVRQEEALINYHQQLTSFRAKSPVVAGLLSAAVPGLGKIYAGKPSEGIAALLYTGAMVATSLDLGNRLGFDNPFAILSASITGIFYLGNIQGSITAARRVQNDFYHEMDQRILFDMHIPLRTIYP